LIQVNRDDWYNQDNAAKSRTSRSQASLALRIADQANPDRVIQTPVDSSEINLVVFA
jgi:hypothetical protein